MTSRLAKREWEEIRSKREREVVKDEEDEDTIPFDMDSVSANLEDDPLADNNTDDGVSQSSNSNVEMKVKEEVADDDGGDGGRQLRCSSNSPGSVAINNVQRRKVFIVQNLKQTGLTRTGRPRKYFTEEERLKAKNEKQKQQRAKRSKEEYEESLRKQRERNRLRRGRMTENPEKYEEKKRKQREYDKKRKDSDLEKHEEIKKKQREKMKQWRKKNPEKYEEQKRKFREKCKANAKKKEETEEEKESNRMKKRLYYRKMRETEEGREILRFRQFSQVQMKLAKMTDEERKEWTTKNTEAARKWRYNLTGEKLERYRENMRNNKKKYIKNPEVVARQRERVKMYCRYRCAKETPEERQKRLRRYKINQAMSKLRKQLEEIGVPHEEVERRVTELKSEMLAEPLPPLETLSTYKPRIKAEVTYTPRLYTGKRRGRPPRSSGPTVSSGEAGMEDSNNFDDGVQCDTNCANDDNASSRYKADANEETTTVEPESVPIHRFDIKCPHCPSTFSERSDLISHISSQHSENCWKCPKCKIVVLSSDDLSEHYKKEHIPIQNMNGSTETTNSNSDSKDKSSKKGNIFTCIKCDPLKSRVSDRTFLSLKDLKCHVKSTHPESFWPCYKCNILKYSESALKIHEKVCKRPGRRKKPSGRKII